MQFMTDIGKTIARKRKGRGLTQAELARRIGCHRTHLALIEVGRSKPSQKLLDVIDDQLSITRDRKIIRRHACFIMAQAQVETGLRFNYCQRMALVKLFARELERRSNGPSEGTCTFVCACGRKHTITTAETD